MGEGHFEVLDAAECSLLLREATVGRVVFNGPDGLTVVPVSYTLEGERITLRTAGHTQLAGLAEGTDVAFEVDEFDAACRNGWSVLVRGTLAVRADRSPDGGEPEPFVPGVRERRLAIDSAMMTGRAVAAA